jgi:hypothetical protein
MVMIDRISQMVAFVSPIMRLPISLIVPPDASEIYRGLRMRDQGCCLGYMQVVGGYTH